MIFISIMFHDLHVYSVNVLERSLNFPGHELYSAINAFGYFCCTNSHFKQSEM